MNKNIFVKFSLTLLAGITAFVFGKTDAFQKSNNSHLLADSEPVTCEIKYVNIAFANGPYLLYAVKTENTDQLPCMCIWTTGDGVYDKEDAIHLPIYQTNFNINGDYYTTFIYDQIAAKQMTDYIYARAYVEDTYSNLFRYSVLEYALKIFENHDETDLITKLMNDLLTYGETSQFYFDYHTDRLPTAQYHSLTLNNCVLNDGFDNGIFTSSESITINSINGSEVYWTMIKDNNYIDCGFSSSIVITDLDSDAKIMAHELPIIFILIMNDNTTVKKNDEFFNENYISVNNGDDQYSRSDFTLTINNDVYSFTPNAVCIEQYLSVVKVSTNPLVYEIHYEVDFTYLDVLHSLKSQLEDINNSRLILKDCYSTLMVLLDRYISYYDTYQEQFIIEEIEWIKNKMLMEQANFSLYMYKVDQIIEKVNSYDLDKSSKTYIDAMAAIEECRKRIYENGHNLNIDGFILETKNRIISNIESALTN